MLKAELLELIANGENSGVEFKRDDIRPEQLAKEISAFANLQGGRILLGVEDDGEISGLQRIDAQEWVLNVFRDKVHPQIIPFYEELVVDGNRRVGVVTLTAGVSKPYVVRHNNREDAYIRLGNRSEPATREQQLRLYEMGGLLHVEALPIPGTSFASLDKSRLDGYLRLIIKDADIPASDESWIARLSGMGLMAEDGMGHTVCTIAGMVCFGLKPRRYLPQAGLRVMSFESADKDYAAKLDVALDAPLVGRWETDNFEQKILIDDGLIEKFAAAITPFITQEAATIDKNMRREKSWFYPWEAVREVAINALAHRDWTRSIDIEVTNYSDRLEVVSPGSFQNSMNIEKMIAGRRSHRNSLIVGILRDYGYIDARGMGIRTKVLPLMRSQNKTDPQFEATEDFVKTTLFRKPAGGERAGDK
jgi:ATP-dependent DNA helicase RecG